MDVVIFGAGTFASSVWYRLCHDSPHRVVGFTVDRPHLVSAELHGLPVVPFDDLEARFPASAVGLMMAVGGADANRLRSERFVEAKARGYAFVSHVSSRASVWPDLELGEGSLVLDGAAINPFAAIGSNCAVGSLSHIGHHSRLGSHCYLAPHVVIPGNVTVGERCFLGAGCVLRDGIHVAERCIVAAGAVVTADTQPGGIYAGVPARRVEKMAPDGTLPG